MQSVVVLYVDHGETTDPLVKLIDDAFMTKGASVFNYELQVDVNEARAEKALSHMRDLHLWES